MASERPFDELPRTAESHFALHVHAAILHLAFYLHRLSYTGGEPLEQVLERYPFLGDYLAAIRSHLPDPTTWDKASGWWEEAIEAWQADCTDHLPLRALADEAGLDFASRVVLIGVGLVEEDSRFGAVFAELQEPLAQRRPTLELLTRMLACRKDGDASARRALTRLIASGLVEVLNPGAPRAEWVCGLAAAFWDALRGELAERPLPGCRIEPRETLPALAELILDPRVLDRLTRLPRLLEAGSAQTVVVRSGYGGEPGAVLGAIARELGRHLMRVDGAKLDRDGWVRLAPLCVLAHALPVIAYDPGPGETAALPDLALYRGPVGVILGLDGGLSGALAEGAVTLELPAPDQALRRRHWTRALAGRAGGDLEEIAERFHFAGGLIERVARGAMAEAGLNGRKQVVPGDIVAASRQLNRQSLDTLANRLECRGSWSDLVATEATSAKLLELMRRCRHRERLLGRLGAAFDGSMNRGVRGLLTGASGTGKTLAARILAAELGMDLYRVNLAAIVNKYIGETEKNLQQILARAEGLDVVLLIDEGDALLGGRTEVRSANDRYANLETNYLLQRLEIYDGIILVTTNLAANIDQAFQRRMDIVVPFFPPQPEERWHILLHHLPPDHVVPPGFLDLVALRCALTGGQLRNAVVAAALLALDHDTPLAAGHLEAGLRSEYRKAGGVYPLAGAEVGAPCGAGADAFLSALVQH